MTVPEANQGDIMGDLNGKRGRIQGSASIGGGEVEIVANVPSSEILRYAIDLRSMTGGRGRFSATHSHYDPVPAHLVDKIVVVDEGDREGPLVLGYELRPSITGRRRTPSGPALCAWPVLGYELRPSITGRRRTPSGPALCAWPVLGYELRPSITGRRRTRACALRLANIRYDLAPPLRPPELRPVFGVALGVLAEHVTVDRVELDQARGCSAARRRCTPGCATPDG